LDSGRTALQIADEHKRPLARVDLAGGGIGNGHDEAGAGELVGVLLGAAAEVELPSPGLDLLFGGLASDADTAAARPGAALAQAAFAALAAFALGAVRARPGLARRARLCGNRGFGSLAALLGVLHDLRQVSG